MSTTENKAVLRTFLEAWNPRDGGDWSVGAEDCAFHSVAGELTLEGIRQVSKVRFSAFPDLRGTLEDLVAEGDRVVSREAFCAMPRHLAPDHVRYEDEGKIGQQIQAAKLVEVNQRTNLADGLRSWVSPGYAVPTRRPATDGTP